MMTSSPKHNNQHWSALCNMSTGIHFHEALSNENNKLALHSRDVTFYLSQDVHTSQFTCTL